MVTSLIEAQQEAFLLIAEHLPKVIAKGRHINIWYNPPVRCVCVIGDYDLFLSESDTPEQIKQKLAKFEQDLINDY